MKLLIAIAVVVALLTNVTAALAAPSCSYQLGFAAFAQSHPEVGICLSDEGHRASGDAIQYTTTGYLLWSKADNTVTFRPKSDGNPYGASENPYHADTPASNRKVSPIPPGCIAWVDGHCRAAYVAHAGSQ